MHKCRIHLCTFDAFLLKNRYHEIAKTCPGVSLCELAADAVEQFITQTAAPKPLETSMRRWPKKNVPILTKDYTPFSAFTRHNPNAQETKMVRAWKELPAKKQARFVKMADVFRENIRNDLKFRVKAKRAWKRLDALRATPAKEEVSFYEHLEKW